MKFISWNIARRTAALPLALETFNPDIAFFQEAKYPTMEAPAGYFSLGNSINERGRTQTWGNLIISKTPLAPVDLGSEYRGSMIAATTTLDNGLTLGLLNLYGLLESTPENPKLKIVHFGVHRMLSDAGFWLAQFIEPKVDAFIVAGDLNKDRKMDGGTGFKSGRQIASNLLNRFSDFGLNELLPNYYPDGVKTFRHSTSKVDWQIDHLFISEGLSKSVESLEVVDNQFTAEASDHFPISMTLRTERKWKPSRVL